MSGIKETQDVCIAAIDIGMFILSRVRDGVGVDDVVALQEKIANDPVFLQHLTAAWDKREEVPVEIARIDVIGGAKLAWSVGSYLVAKLKEFK